MIDFIIRSLALTGAVAGAKKLWEWLSESELVLYELTFEHGAIRLTAGTAPTSQRVSSCAEILRAVRVETATVWCVETEGKRRLRFSDEVPANAHQQLRNALLG